MSNLAKDILLISFPLITIATVVFIVLANVGYFGEEVREGSFAKQGMTVVLIEIVGAVVYAYKAEWAPSANVLVVFDQISSMTSGMKLRKCDYEIANLKGKQIGKGTVSINALESGRLGCFIPLPHSMKYEDTTTMTITPEQGSPFQARAWILQHTLEI